MSHDDGQHLFDKPRNVQRVVRGLFILCIVLIGLDVVLHRHVEHAAEELFGFYALYGFVACVLLVLLAKEIRKLVMRDEDFYQNDGDDLDPGAAQSAAEKEDGHV